MTFKSASLAIALVLGAASGVAAAPLAYPQGLSNADSLAQQVRHKRYAHHWYGYWRHCPYWYEQNLLGQWRLFSPCSNRVTTHAF